MAVVVGVLSAITICAISFRTFGGRITAFALILVVYVYLDRLVYIFGTLSSHVGVAPSVPVLWTYNLVIFGFALVAFISDGRRSLSWFQYWIIGYLLFSTIMVWGNSALNWAGTLHFATAILAFTVGRYFGKYIKRDEISGRNFTIVLFLSVLGQTVISILQLLGYDLFPLNEDTAALMRDRINGSFGHPTALGKFIVIISAVLLPFTRSRNRNTKYIAYISLTLGLIPLVFSGGRSNLLGAMAMIILWALTTTGKGRTKRRWITLGMAGIALWASAGMLVARFAQDPEGETRQHFNEVALSRLPFAPWFGTGANTYVEAVGPYDSLTAEGWPVHNALLLNLVELGVIGTALLWMPAIALVIASFRTRRNLGTEGDFARAVLSSLPAMSVIIFTGWGLMNGNMTSLWFLFMGIMFAQIHFRDRHTLKTHKLSENHRGR